MVALGQPHPRSLRPGQGQTWMEGLPPAGGQQVPWPVASVTKGPASPQGLTAAPFGHNSEGLKVRPPRPRPCPGWSIPPTAVYAQKGHDLIPWVGSPRGRTQATHWVAKDPSPGKLPELNVWGGWAGAADLGGSVTPQCNPAEKQQAPAVSRAMPSPGMRSHGAFLGHPEPICVRLTSSAAAPEPAGSGWGLCSGCFRLSWAQTQSHSGPAALAPRHGPQTRGVAWSWGRPGEQGGHPARAQTWLRVWSGILCPLGFRHRWPLPPE